MSPLGNLREFLGDHWLELGETNGEEIQPPLRYSAPAECVDDLPATFSADFHSLNPGRTAV